MQWMLLIIAFTFLFDDKMFSKNVQTIVLTLVAKNDILEAIKK